MKLSKIIKDLLGDEKIPETQEEKYNFLCDYYKCPKKKRTFTEKHYKYLKKKLKKEIKEATG